MAQLNDVQPLEDALAVLLQQLAPPARRTLMREIAKTLRQRQKKQIQAQKNPDGSPYIPRKRRVRDKGGNGGLTALGDLLTLPGGDGGPAGVGGTNGYGGAGYPYGETAIGGNLNGMNTFYLTAASGASCAFGEGGPGGHVGSQGAHHARPAYGYGAGGGGGGGTRIAGTAGGNGGDGVGGLLMLEW